LTAPLRASAPSHWLQAAAATVAAMIETIYRLRGPLVAPPMLGWLLHAIHLR
jgi:hypothetical protein